MRGFLRLLWSAALIVALVAALPPFTAPRAAQSADDPTPVATPGDMPVFLQEDLGPATRDIGDDVDAVIQAALVAYLQRTSDLLVLAAPDALAVSAIPSPIPPVYLPLIMSLPMQVVLPPQPTPVPPPPGADVT
ncbi:MAG: hypothetical protein J7463_02630, partial [Roseiflexus sp.]|nr:hypothetical protein [Roseiflexus sp.]